MPEHDIMYNQLFAEFTRSGNSLCVYQGEKLVFSSRKDRLLPLLDYLDSKPVKGSVIFDKIIGNAAALLCVHSGCRAVWSPKGSRQAIDTLTHYGVEYHFTEIVPFIQRLDGAGMCPMEQASLDQEPRVFYEALKIAVARSVPRGDVQ